jgi:hypothetical protein
VWRGGAGRGVCFVSWPRARVAEGDDLT